MSIVLTQPQISGTARKTRSIIAAEALEFIVFCPKCSTLETVWFTEDGLLVPTRKSNQHGGWLYHDCDSDESCRLYRIS